jgi:hypothetical protein
MDFATPALNLDVIGALEGTDKSSSVRRAWDYLRHYQEQFAPWRDEPINLIEIGIAGGHSLKVWEAYFAKANIVGVDIDPRCTAFSRERVCVEIGSQEDPGFLHAVCAKYPPSIVIDDGSHQAHHVVFTFEQIFPALLPGGLYVVEDTQFHFEGNEPGWLGDGSVAIPDYFGAIARTRMAIGMEGKNLWGLKKYISAHVDSIMFIGGAIFLRKRAPRDIRSAIEYGDTYLSRCSPTPAHYVRFAEFILRHGGPLDRAAQAARQAVEQGDPTSAAHSTLVVVLERQGRLEEAAETAGQAAQRWPSQADIWLTLGRIQRRRRQHDAAIEALQKAVALRPSDFVAYSELSQALEEANDQRGALAAAIKAADLAAGRPHQAGLAQRVEVLRARVAAATS